jgi:hypothetical protein
MKKVTSTNCLEAMYPDIAAEWHPTKNGEITPKDVVGKSGKKAWWMCKKGHEWETIIASRTSRGSGCPCCSYPPRKVCIDNCLQTVRPDIAAEWHPTKNGEITPKDVIARAAKKYWWICGEGHEWQQSPDLRFNRGCPYCTNRLLGEDNSLLKAAPAVAAEWHPTKNGGAATKGVFVCSNKKYWWQCEKGHEWESVVSSRTSQGTGCPYCCDPPRLVCEENCLQTVRPDIAAEWHPTKNGEITPKDVIAKSGKKYWWLCGNGHDYYMSSLHRLRGGKKRVGCGCPFCSNQQTCEENCLQTVRPDIAAEWHPTKNRTTTPDLIVSGSVSKYWWICKNGHEWVASPSKRIRGTGCPICNESRGERSIGITLTASGVRFERQYRFADCKWDDPLKFDFAVFTDDGIALIEYQGQQHFHPVNWWTSQKTDPRVAFSLQIVKDRIKLEYSNRNNIPLLTIPYWKDKEIGQIVEDFLEGKEVERVVGDFHSGVKSEKISLRRPMHG